MLWAFIICLLISHSLALAQIPYHNILNYENAKDKCWSAALFLIAESRRTLQGPAKKKQLHSHLLPEGLHNRIEGKRQRQVG
jgi:hypothetical protein